MSMRRAARHDELHETICPACADRGTSMRVVDDPSDDGLAVCIDRLGELRLVETSLLGSVVPGDHLLVHADVAIARAPQAA